MARDHTIEPANLRLLYKNILTVLIVGSPVVRACRGRFLWIFPPENDLRFSTSRARQARVREKAKVDRPGKGRVCQGARSCFHRHC